MFFEGPKLPKRLKGHSCVTQGNEMIVIGGYSDSGLSSDLFKLTLENGQFEWTTLDVKLNTPRAYFVASLIPVQFNWISKWETKKLQASCTCQIYVSWKKLNKK